ncbi:MAG: hypothetical protein ACSLE1_17235 [Sphingobium sp.]
MNYLARRCDHPDRLLATLFRLASPGRSQSISSFGDIHLNIRPCALGAITVIGFQGQHIEASIIGKSWSIHADSSHTDVTLAYLPHSARAFTERSLLCEKFDIAFLPRELEIEMSTDIGPGVRISCQPITAKLELAPKSADQGLNDVWGAVSGSDAAS